MGAFSCQLCAALELWRIIHPIVIKLLTDVTLLFIFFPLVYINIMKTWNILYMRIPGNYVNLLCHLSQWIGISSSLNKFSIIKISKEARISCDFREIQTTMEEALEETPEKRKGWCHVKKIPSRHISMKSIYAATQQNSQKDLN